MKCPGYRGKWIWWGRCKHASRFGIGWLLEEGSTEYLCQHPALILDNKPPYVGVCPTRGKKPQGEKA